MKNNIVLQDVKKLKIQNIMIKKVVTEKEDASVEMALKKLYKFHIGSIIIIDKEKNCIGIFSERDAIRVIAQKIPLDTPLKTVMTKNVVTIRKNESYEKARRLMLSHRIRHLPVIDKNGKIVGIFTLRGLLDEILGIRPIKS
jgi:CBS domain-containing protein